MSIIIIIDRRNTNLVESINEDVQKHSKMIILENST